MGSRRVFSDEQEKFIFDNYKGKSNQKICDLLYAKFKQVFTTRQIIWFKNRHGLHSFDPLFPKEIVAYIQDNRLEKFHQDLTDEINNQFGTSYTKKQVTNYLRDHTLPTGTRGLRPEIYKEGDSFVRNNGHIYIKMNGKIIKKSRYIVEQSGVTLSQSDCVLHLDGDFKNCRSDNLVVVTKGENLCLNSKHWRTDNRILNQCAIDVVKLQAEIQQVQKHFREDMSNEPSGNERNV